MEYKDHRTGMTLEAVRGKLPRQHLPAASSPLLDSVVYAPLVSPDMRVPGSELRGEWWERDNGRGLR